jgi:hypothetical protein
MFLICFIISVTLNAHTKKKKKYKLKSSMPIILEVVFGILGVAIGGTCYANRKK